jgi:hypothetical protein
MRAQYALALPGRVSLPAARRRKSTGLGLVVMFMALSPVFAVCGFMLAQILGYIPR